MHMRIAAGRRLRGGRRLPTVTARVEGAAAALTLGKLDRNWPTRALPGAVAAHGPWPWTAVVAQACASALTICTPLAAAKAVYADVKLDRTSTWGVTVSVPIPPAEAAACSLLGHGAPRQLRLEVQASATTLAVHGLAVDGRCVLPVVERQTRADSWRMGPVIIYPEAWAALPTLRAWWGPTVHAGTLLGRGAARLNALVDVCFPRGVDDDGQ